MLHLGQQVDKGGRVLLHIGDDPIDARGEEVVAELDEDTDDQTGSGGDQRLGNAAGHLRGNHVTRLFDRLEGADHAAHRSQETHHRRQVGHRRQPRSKKALSTAPEFSSDFST